MNVLRNIIAYLINLFTTILMFCLIFQKLLEAEDAVEDERKDLTGKIESLESIVRMLELKAKNSSDHGEFLTTLIKFV